MISMARIQGLSLGHANWQRPIFPLMLGQNGNGAPAPTPTPPSPSPTPPSVDFQPVPVFPTPIYNYPVVTEPPVVVTPKPEATPWGLIAAGVAAGVVITLLLT
jgi:hypothetical protein